MRPGDQGAIRVVIVEDHRLVAEALTSLLSGKVNIQIVALARDRAELASLPAETMPDVVLLDFRLPDGLAVDDVATVKQRWPNVAVVFLSADVTEESMLAAVESGAVGYVLKSAAASELEAAVQTAAEGHIVFSQQQLAGLLLRQQHRQRRRFEEERQVQEQRRLQQSLTDRERAVLKLIVSGLDNKSIARQLEIGTGTVRAHVQHVLEKLGVHSKLQAAALAVERGLVKARQV
jgi:two-component system, NarL family, nitrate/nitrite response regulator NarL